MEKFSPFCEIFFAEVFLADREICKNVFKEGEETMDEGSGLTLCNKANLEGLEPLFDQ